MPPPAAAPRKTSKLPLIAGLGVVIAGGAVLAVVLLRGGGGGGGAGSRDDLIKDTFAAFEAGDGATLIRLADPAGLWSKVVECKPGGADDRKSKSDDKDDFRDPEKLVAKAKKLYARIGDGAKGTKIEIVEIVTPAPAKLEDDADGDKKKHVDSSTDDNTFTIHKGEDSMPGCQVKQTFRMQTVKVRVKVTEGGHEPRSDTTRIAVIEAAGRYYLQGVPDLKLAGVLAKMAESFRDDMCACTDKDCTEKVEHDYKDVARELKEASGDSKDRLASIDKEYKACRKKAGGKGSGGMDEALDKMGELTDQMCACKDKACADKVLADMTTWGQEMSKDPEVMQNKSDEDTAKKMSEVTKRLSDCMMKAMGSM
jgi:hypothetical protein